MNSSHNRENVDDKSSSEELNEIIIPKEKALFWLDENGNWNNEHGRFEHRKIIQKFNTSISKDNHGYFVTQINGKNREKVYFHYEDTALFAIDLIKKEELYLLLNTRKKIKLNPKNLFMKGDALYLVDQDEWIKFSVRVLLKISSMMQENGEGFSFHWNEQSYLIGNCSP